MRDKIIGPLIVIICKSVIACQLICHGSFKVAFSRRGRFIDSPGELINGILEHVISDELLPGLDILARSLTAKVQGSDNKQHNKN